MHDLDLFKLLYHSIDRKSEKKTIITNNESRSIFEKKKLFHFDIVNLGLYIKGSINYRKRMEITKKKRS